MLPLITHANDQPIAYRQKRAITAAQYLADVAYCASQLPASSFVLLACQDRYAFAVVFGAAMVRQQTCLLPSTYTEELIESLALTHEGLYCLTDEPNCAIKLKKIHMGDWLLQPIPPAALAVPKIAQNHVAACVFTSGSTGLPVAHRKTWGRLVVNVHSEGKRLGVVNGSNYCIVGTVPPQHMYGFESTVLIALQNGCAFEASKPFYPADIEKTMQGVPRPRALVTTPFHLRALMTELKKPVEIDLLVCATAPLAVALALEAEQKTNAQLIEIYGSTETGQLATRRTTETAEWKTFDGIELSQKAEKFYAKGQQVEGVVEVNDVLELNSTCSFILHGRTADMVNVAGKSTTLNYLNHQLLSIAGIEDGVFFVTDTETEGVGSTARLAAVVVSSSLSAENIMTALRRKIAPAFLPRPLKLISKLPRNATGKLPRDELLALIRSALDN